MRVFCEHTEKARLDTRKKLSAMGYMWAGGNVGLSLDFGGACYGEYFVYHLNERHKTVTYNCLAEKPRNSVYYKDLPIDNDSEVLDFLERENSGLSAEEQCL